MSNEFKFTKEVTGEIVQIPVDYLVHHPDNPRKDLGDLAELTDSIRAKGVLQNLTVVPKPGFNVYHVVIGNRRLEAATAAGLETLPCVIADMTPAEQVQTMLLENMQRSDLTMFEQAQGFQMMMDFGDSVDDVAAKTGFSKTTIRRRLKMAELDADTMQKVSGRQVTMEDFDRLAKIEDIKRRNEVLEHIGTSNFDWKCKNAIDRQENEKLSEKWRAVLTERGLVEIDSSEKWNREKYSDASRSYSKLNACAPEKYTLTGDEQYFLFDEYGTVYFRKDRPQTETDEEKDERERKRAEKRARDDARDAAAKQAYEMRFDFVKNYPESKAQKNVVEIIKQTIAWKIDGDYRYHYDKSIYQDSESDELPKNFDDIAASVACYPFRSLLLHAYACFGDGYDTRYFDWDGDFDENDRLDSLYAFLVKLGYEMSDEEKAMQDGTSELFEQPDKEDDE